MRLLNGAAAMAAGLATVTPERRQTISLRRKKIRPAGSRTDLVLLHSNLILPQGLAA
jgi:hypothetical protein